MQRILLLFIAVQLAYCCQPPLPAFQQVPPPPPPAPPLPQSPQLGLQQANLVSGVQQLASQNANPSFSNSLDQELTPFSQGPDSAPKPTFTPYPGYIPPPPATPGISSRIPVRENGIQNLALDDGESVTGCPQSITSLNHVFSCLQLLAPIPVDQESLNCSFEQGTKCRMQPTSPSFQVARLPSASHYRDVARLAGRPETQQPQGDFLALMDRTGSPNEEYVISTPVTCQNDSGFLKLDFWFLGDHNGVLHVCTQDMNARWCTKEILHFPGSSVVVQVVHPNVTVFDVEVVITNITRPTVLIIDNLEYKAQLCEDTLRDQPTNVIEATPSPDIVESFFEEEEGTEGTDDEQTGLVPSRPPTEVRDGPMPPESFPEERGDDDFVPIRDGPPAMSPFDLEIRNSPLHINKLNPCSQMSCDFNTDFCGYKNYRNETKNHEWQWGSSRVGNPHTGIKEKNADGGFLYVGTDTDDNSILTYILESPNLHLNEDATLQMDIYRRSRDITLQVCLNSPNHCPMDVPAFKKESDWLQGVEFHIPQSTTHVYLKAIQWRKFKWLAIDNIRIVGPKECST